MFGPPGPNNLGYVQTSKFKQIWLCSDLEIQTAPTAPSNVHICCMLDIWIMRWK